MRNLTKILLTSSLTAAFLVPAFSQEATPSNEDERPGIEKRDKMRSNIRDKIRDRVTEGLSPEEKKRFETARQQALNDPEIKALREKAESANKEFFEAMKKKMNEIDPGLAEVLRQKRPGPGGRPEGKQGRKPGAESTRGFASLSEGERQRLMAAREVAKQLPSVKAAEEQRAAATSKDEKKSADQAFSKAMREAVLQADPGLESVLDKLSGPSRGSKNQGTGD